MSAAHPATPPALSAEAVRELMARVYRRSGHDLSGLDHTTSTPLDDLIRQEEGQPEDHYCAGNEMLGRFLEWVFQRGPNPPEVMKRIYAVAHALRPDLLLNMSGAEIAAIFDETRAAESARMMLLNKKMKAAGFKHTSFVARKSETARRRMALSALGNQNRRKGRKKTAA